MLGRRGKYVVLRGMALETFEELEVEWRESDSLGEPKSKRV